MARANLYFRLFLLLLAAVSFTAARMLVYWKEGVPGPGFFPLWLSLLLALLTAVSLLTGKFPRGVPFLKPPAVRRVAVTSGLTLLATLLIPWLGMLPVIGLYLAGMSFILGGVRRRTALLTALLVPIGIYYLFEVWLGVPLPVGFLGF
ncbi:MAG: tripartite tricarboxylate transporter TctB family protein [Firmicutes bacterium]|nr:tripartite tricarboxylate transporter TctB family protein [Bacillota bacterium]